MEAIDTSFSNYYKILGIDLEAEEAAIRKAYRKKALECHPDKNPDNPKAAELFHKLSKALETLTDPAARTAYDKTWRARKAKEIRHKQLDTKRRKMKEDLEKREREAGGKSHFKQAYSTDSKTDEESILAQMDRIRRESARLLEEQQKLQEQFRRDYIDKLNSKPCNDSTQHRIKIKWKSDKNDANNGGYNKDVLIAFLKKYGDIVALVMGKKNGAAMIEFQNREAAEMAVSYEKGFLKNPLHLEWVKLPANNTTHPNGSSTINSMDYEDLVMRKLRQAAERQQLIEQMLKEDEDNVKN